MHTGIRNERYLLMCSCMDAVFSQDNPLDFSPTQDELKAHLWLSVWLGMIGKYSYEYYICKNPRWIV